ncbi:hypothetical protein AQ436_10545 [Arthrobacter sp. EpRS66]|nr:hypothetical protein AQ436_10545 [Arthrobacter sp. EpRS66]
MTKELPPSLRVAVYARQSVNVREGIEQQLADCRAEAKRRGWIIYDEYEDNATSASDARGPKTRWRALLSDYDTGAFDAVLANDADRLLRDIADLVLEIRKRKLRVLTVRGSLDTNDPNGAYFLGMNALSAEREIQIKKARAERYARDRRKIGHPTAGRTPHGYDWVPNIDRDEAGTRYRVNENEAQDVRRIYEEFLNGAPLGQIARDLTSDNRLTRAGKKWYASTVRKVLMNPQYAALLAPAQETGKFRMDAIDLDACVPGAWKPIVTDAELRATRAKLVGVKPNHQSTTRKWLLSGLAVCDVCESPVRSARGETKPTARVATGETAPRQRYHAYRCPDNGHFMRKGDVIDELVAEVCVARLSQDDARDLLTPPEDGIDVAALNAQLIELEGREASIALMVASGKLNQTAAEAALDQLHAELHNVNDQIAQSVRRDPLAEVVGLKDVRAWWEGLTLARKRVVIEMLMQVRIKPVGYGRKVNTTEQALETVEIIWKMGDHQ